MSTKKYFIPYGPDNIPIWPESFDTRAEAEQCLAEFPKRFVRQGYYSGVGYRLPLDKILDHCRIEEGEDDEDDCEFEEGGDDDRRPDSERDRDDSARHLGDEHPENWQDQRD